ncbi:MAG: flavoprotein [Spirochaetales bacterium]|nr:flavoprotein [Spirochaetales bacterium]
MSSSNILLAVTGSIAAYKAAALSSSLVKKGYEVQCITTKGAQQFVGEMTFEGITNKRVLHDMFAPGDAKIHISLAEWAHLIVVYPASAAALSRLATGDAQDLLGAVFLANNFRKPFLIAPAMNVHMYAHPAVQQNLEQLADWGCEILPTEEGRLACGDYGKGRAIAPERVVERVEQLCRM